MPTGADAACGRMWVPAAVTPGDVDIQRTGQLLAAETEQQVRCGETAVAVGGVDLLLGCPAVGQPQPGHSAERHSGGAWLGGPGRRNRRAALPCRFTQPQAEERSGLGLVLV